MPAHRRGFAAAVPCLATLLVLGAAPAQAQDYPTRPVRIVTDSAPGSALDAIMRIAADALTRVWGQQAVILNQPGAGGSIAARAASTSPPDGYTLFIPALSTFVALPGAAANLPIEVPRDFAPVGFLGGAPMFIAAAPALGVQTLADLVALAKKRPGEIVYGTNGRGRLTHLTGELLASRTGVKLLMVPYSGGTAQILNDVMGGRVPLVIEALSGIAGAIEAGTIRPLAVASPERMPDFPNLPTVAETIPGFAASGWQAMVAPVGTPETIVRKVSADLELALTDPAVGARLAALWRYNRPMTPREVADFIHREQAMWKPILEQIERNR
jgi:tripartite-type tricarboxylate transporter receptor subunit TctC